MKFRNIFTLCEDAQAMSSMCDGVETAEQMSSALERLRKGDAASDFLEIVHSLRLSTEAVLEDTIEPGGPLGEGDLPDGFGDDIDGEDLLDDEEGKAADPSVAPKSEKPAEIATSEK